jgi:CBS domain-containing protein
MKVESIMARSTVTCRPGASLAEAAKLMWDGDFGFLPAVEDGKLVGVVTDRDICIGSASMARPATQIPVSAIMARTPIVCSPDEELKAALKKMSTHQLRRLPVVDAKHKLQGVLSMNDIIQEMHQPGAAADGPVLEEVFTALKSIGKRRGIPAVTTP